MPEVSEKEIAQKQEKEDPSTDSPKKKKGINIIFIIIILELLAIGAAFATVNFVLKPRIPEWAIPVEAEPEEEVAEPLEPGVIITFSDLVINPAGSQGTRYLSASIGIEVSDEEIKHQVELRSAAVRDALIGILSAETVEQLTSVDEREFLRKKIIRDLNILIAPIEVRNAYFIDYVIQ
ncbi:MAG: flagellar basal body-associated FliL family protein [candidate division Zixibacteria bacterium]|nr:flagellar basal body-associated FliL family protein [candidate division Zixibacteria bacterium]